MRRSTDRLPRDRMLGLIWHPPRRPSTPRSSSRSPAGATRSRPTSTRRPPEWGKNPRPVLKVKPNEPVRIQYMLTNVYPHKTLENVVVHFFVVREEKAGQKEIPDLKGEVVLESAFDMDFKPGGKAGQRTTLKIDEPGAYLIRVETRNTQSDHEHFAAIDLVVEQGRQALMPGPSSRSRRRNPQVPPIRRAAGMTRVIGSRRPTRRADRMAVAAAGHAPARCGVRSSSRRGGARCRFDPHAIRSGAWRGSGPPRRSCSWRAAGSSPRRPDRTAGADPSGSPASPGRSPSVSGRATFRVATPGPSSETLVVVSALSRSPGPFPIRLTARPATRAEIPTLGRRRPASEPAAAMPRSRRRPRTPRRRRASACRPRERVFHVMVRDGDPAQPEQLRRGPRPCSRGSDTRSRSTSPSRTPTRSTATCWKT